MNKSELEKRLKDDAEVFRSQMSAKDERLHTLTTANQHVASLLQRNSELEESMIIKQREMSGQTVLIGNLSD